MQEQRRKGTEEDMENGTQAQILRGQWTKRKGETETGWTMVKERENAKGKIRTGDLNRTEKQEGKGKKREKGRKRKTNLYLYRWKKEKGKMDKNTTLKRGYLTVHSAEPAK